MKKNEVIEVAIWGALAVSVMPAFVFGGIGLWCYCANQPFPMEFIKQWWPFGLFIYSCAVFVAAGQTFGGSNK